MEVQPQIRLGRRASGMVWAPRAPMSEAGLWPFYRAAGEGFSAHRLSNHQVTSSQTARGVAVTCVSEAVD